MIYDLLIVFSFFHDCAYGNGRIDNFTELFIYLLNKYYKYGKNM